MEGLFIGCDDGVEPSIIVGVAWQYDLDALARFADDAAGVAVAPLAQCID